MGQYGISPERFQENQNLSSFFKILTTSTDEDNKVLNVTMPSYLIWFTKSRAEFDQIWESYFSEGFILLFVLFYPLEAFWI